MPEPHVLDTAPREELEALTTADIYRYAEHLGIQNRKGKNNKAVIIDEILRMREEAADTEPAPKTQQNLGIVTPPESFEPPEDRDTSKITPDEARKLESASDDAIRQWLDTHQTARSCLIEYAWLVLAQRAEARMQERKRQELQSDIEQYEVTRGGRIVVNSLPTTLATGSIISPSTHDFRALAEQGIVARKIARAIVFKDDFGLSHTKIELE